MIKSELRRVVDQYITEVSKSERDLIAGQIIGLMPSYDLAASQGGGIAALSALSERTCFPSDLGELVLADCVVM